MSPGENNPEQTRDGERLERRVHPRAQCWGSAGIRILPEGALVMGYLIDLGLGGCSIDADEPFPVEMGGRVEALIELNGLTLRLAGSVVRMEENDFRLGIKFMDVSPRKEEQIRQLMAAIVAAEEERAKGIEELGG